MQSLRHQFDSQNIYQIIADLPKQFTSALAETTISIAKNTEKIIFCGMGGSALPANLVKTYLAKTNTNFNIPIKINRDYSLPKVVNKNWCGFFDSYSGNTEETLSALAEAEKKGMKQIIILAHGGKLEKIAKKKNYKFIKLPETNQPRLAYGYVVGAMLKVLHNSGFLKLNINSLNKDINSALKIQAQIQTQAQKLSKKLINKVPIVYSSNSWKYIAMVWKINFNENTKIPSFWNAFPEMNHNELVGYTNPIGNYQILILKDQKDHKQIQKRMLVFKKILDKKLDIEILDMRAGSEFFKLITTLMLGLWTSYNLALLYKTDPAPVALVENFKKLL